MGNKMNDSRGKEQKLPDRCRLKPLLDAIDSLLAQNGRGIVAIEGKCTSGKTTLAAWLGDHYNCNVFHLDDYFLRLEQRTPERFAQPGGNVDWERFQQEVLLPLTRGEQVLLRRFDCRSMEVCPPVPVPCRPLSIVEGVYCMRPTLAGSYDLSVFLDIDEETQRIRVMRREPPEKQRDFFEKWIPLENRYFRALQPQLGCDFILEVPHEDSSSH